MQSKYWTLKGMETKWMNAPYLLYENQGEYGGGRQVLLSPGVIIPSRDHNANKPISPTMYFLYCIGQFLSHVLHQNSHINSLNLVPTSTIASPGAYEVSAVDGVEGQWGEQAKVNRPLATETQPREELDCLQEWGDSSYQDIFTKGQILSLAW